MLSIPSSTVCVCVVCALCAGDAAVSNIGEALVSNSSLEMLLVAENPFGDVGGANLSHSLCQNTTLKTLDVQHSRMTADVEKQVVKLYVCVCLCMDV